MCGWVLFHCIYVPQLLYPSFWWGAFRLLLCPGYCKWCFNEHWSVCIFLDYSLMLSTLCFLVISMSLEKYLFNPSSHFFIGLFVFRYWSCMSCLYVLDINPLLVASFVNIFSHSKGCLFVLFMVLFAVQKLFSLIRSHLFIFVFIFITVRVGSKKILLRVMSKGILPVFSSKSFVVISFTFRSFIHFIFVLESVLILLFYT